MFEYRTKEVTEITLAHETIALREFYGAAAAPGAGGGASVHSSPRTRHPVKAPALIRQALGPLKVNTLKLVFWRYFGRRGNFFTC